MAFRIILAAFTYRTVIFCSADNDSFDFYIADDGLSHSGLRSQKQRPFEQSGCCLCQRACLLYGQVANRCCLPMSWGWFWQKPLQKTVILPRRSKLNYDLTSIIFFESWCSCVIPSLITQHAIFLLLLSGKVIYKIFGLYTAVGSFSGKIKKKNGITRCSCPLALHSALFPHCMVCRTISSRRNSITFIVGAVSVP